MDGDVPELPPSDGRPSGQRCLEHGLVAGPDGRCVVCRRARAQQPSPDGPIPVAMEGQPLEAPVGDDAARQKKRLAILLGAGFAALVLVAIIAYALRGGDDADGPVASLTPGAMTPGASLVATDVSAASQRVNVRMYSARWCGVCTSARAWMRQKRIRFVEYDVESSRSAERRLRELNPRGSIPTIEVERRVLVGFAPQSLESAILTAAAQLPRR